MEQVNIEGKRSGEGFVAHKDTLANALSRVLAERVMLFNDDVTVGRKGFLGYLKALAGSNIVKVVPANGNASGEQVIDKGLKVVCGSHQSCIPEGAWIKDKTPFTFTQIRVSSCNAVMPNLGSVELAEALARVLPFTASDDSRAVLQCIKLSIKDSKLTLVSADGYRLAIANLYFDGDEGEVLIHRDDVKGLIPALRKAKRARLAIEQKPDSEGNLLNKYVVIDTELVRYKLPNQDGKYPDYGQIIPSEFTCNASFDTREASRASRSLLSVWYDDNIRPLDHPLILTINDGRIAIEAKEGRGKTEIKADTSGEGKIAVNGKYLLEALKACDGIVNLQMVNPGSPMLFSVDGYQLILMPIRMSELAETEAKRQAEAETTNQAEAEAVAEAEKVAQKAQARTRGKAKRRAKAKAKVKAVEGVKPGKTEVTKSETEQTRKADLVGVA